MPDDAMKEESPEEVRYRLDSETNCRKVAASITSQLAPGLGFILVTANYGSGRFSNTSYVASIERDDAARLLSELLDHWRGEGDHVTEPTLETTTRVREQVYRLREEPLDRLLHGARCSVRDAGEALKMLDKNTAAVQALKMVCEGMAIFDRMVREMHHPAPPPETVS